jgi:hypothetical protein
MGGAYAAGCMAGAMLEIRERHSEGRVVVCRQCDTLPVFTAFLIGGHALEVPTLPPLRGSWHTLCLAEDGSVTVQLNTLERFPS